MLAVLSAVREGGLNLWHFSVEQEILQWKFAFDHIDYAGYITYQHVYLNNLLRKDNSIVIDLITNGRDVSSFGDLFSTIHGDLVTEYFSKETKGTAWSFRSGYDTDIYLRSQ